MQQYIIDSHIHLDLYETSDCRFILEDLKRNKTEFLISVSNHLESAEKTFKLAQEYSEVKPAFGFHPEQSLPEVQEIKDLLTFIDLHKDRMVAVGEVGLPYYLKRQNPKLQVEPYVELLEVFVRKASVLDKPIVLHAIYHDAPIVCDLLEKYSIKHAHFHWFKGDSKTIDRMITNGYFVSVTPDIFYENKSRQLVKQYPLSQMMVETDGPWPFEGPFAEIMTHPKLIHQTIKEIATIKNVELSTVYEALYNNTTRCYRLNQFNSLLDELY